MTDLISCAAALLPCPFCGMYLEPRADYARHPQNDCPVSTMVVFAKGYESWNTRAQPDPRDAVSDAARDVLAERQRQISAEGWTPDQDDAYQNADLAKAAACYAMPTTGFVAKREMPPAHWPWAKSWWKPTTLRRDLVKSGALILAEIERLDRAALAAAKGGAA